MSHYVISPCLGTKDQSCVTVCPVECFFDAGEILVVHPDECIDCGACVPECPVEAVLPEEEISEPELSEELREKFTKAFPNMEIPKREIDFGEFNTKFCEKMESEDKLEDVRCHA